MLKHQRSSISKKESFGLSQNRSYTLLEEIRRDQKPSKAKQGELDFSNLEKLINLVKLLFPIKNNIFMSKMFWETLSLDDHVKQFVRVFLDIIRTQNLIFNTVQKFVDMLLLTPMR